MFTEPLQEESQEIIARLPVEPQVNRRGALGQQQQESLDDLMKFQHVNQNFQPPPTALPPPKRKAFQTFKAKFREFLNHPRWKFRSHLSMFYQTTNSGELPVGIKGVSEDLDDS